jgi:hypothetical protein
MAVSNHCLDAIADGHVGEEVVPVMGDEGIGEEDPERVLQDRGKDVVAKSVAAAVRWSRWVVEEGSEFFLAALGRHCQLRGGGWQRVLDGKEVMVMGKEKGRGSQTHIVQIHVDASVMPQYETPHCINPLYWMRIAIIGAQKPRIFRRDKVS